MIDCQWRSRRGRFRARGELQVESGQDEQVDGERRDQAAENDDGHRLHDLVAKTVTCEEQRGQAKGCREGRNQNRSRGFLGTAEDGARAELFASLVSENMKAGEKRYSVPRGNR